MRMLYRPPTWTAGRLVPSGSASRNTSWVTGAVSPSPKSRKRNRYTIGLPSVHPKEYNGDVAGNVVVFALLYLLVVVFCLVARLAPVGDDVDLAFVARLLNEPQRGLVEFYVLLPELERAVHPRDERGGDDRPDEEQGDQYAVGALYLVGHERVHEHSRDHPEGDRR